MLDHRLRRRANIETTLVQSFVIRSHNIALMVDQRSRRWASIGRTCLSGFLDAQVFKYQQSYT